MIAGSSLIRHAEFSDTAPGKADAEPDFSRDHRNLLQNLEVLPELTGIGKRLMPQKECGDAGVFVVSLPSRSRAKNYGTRKAVSGGLT